MARPKVKIAIHFTQYQALANFATNIVVQMTAAIALFPIPNPTLASITAAAAALQLDINAWGPVGNRGPHADLLQMRADAWALYTLLIAEANYVQNQIDPTKSYNDQAADIALSGFSSKNSPTPQGLLSAPENLHQMFSPGVNIHFPKLKWKKPLNLTSPGNVKLYHVSRGPAVGPPSFLAATTRTQFIDTTAVKGTAYQYAVQAVNTAGPGAGSNTIQVNVPL